MQRGWRAVIHVREWQVRVWTGTLTEVQNKDWHNGKLFGGRFGRSSALQVAAEEAQSKEQTSDNYTASWRVAPLQCCTRVSEPPIRYTEWVGQCSLCTPRPITLRCTKHNSHDTGNKIPHSSSSALCLNELLSLQQKQCDVPNWVLKFLNGWINYSFEFGTNVFTCMSSATTCVDCLFPCVAMSIFVFMLFCWGQQSFS